MYKNLFMVNIDLTERWNDVFNRDKTKNKNILTHEEAIQYITEEYGNILGSFSTEVSNTEIYVISENDIGCINCGN